MTAPKRNIVLRLSKREARVLGEHLSDLSVGEDPVIARIAEALAQAISSPEKPAPPPERIVENHHHYTPSGGAGEMVQGDYGPTYMSQASLDYMRSGATW